MSVIYLCLKCLQFSRQNDAGIQANGVEATEEAGVLHFDAAILDKLQAGGDGLATNFVVANTQLQPENLRANLDGFLQKG